MSAMPGRSLGLVIVLGGFRGGQFALHKPQRQTRGRRRQRASLEK